MLFDTDILIWYLRGSSKAAKVIEDTSERQISTVVYMELLQGARDKKEIKIIRAFLKDAGFEILPLTENIGHRASVYMEEYCLKSGMCMADALLASTAVENQLAIITANRKHYKAITELELKVFRP
ncbi:PIN domain protein [Limihaloglobus sulfuriphilus]|uniref:PIN domain protein n=1 Tax=Limihaloglobus sulfuriphilus TaxID=1851148 RepID=A0A1Q2MHP3_9BACT|nr:type II toxin-antitoxin system VapC family toxin [Limihaloglobus sulfuriphilus]AQQ71817.1 PIN domain protein [Limihaloglobus sulfuriphilus]